MKSTRRRFLKSRSVHRIPCCTHSVFQSRLLTRAFFSAWDFFQMWFHDLINWWYLFVGYIPFVHCILQRGSFFQMWSVDFTNGTKTARCSEDHCISVFTFFTVLALSQRAPSCHSVGVVGFGCKEWACISTHDAMSQHKMPCGLGRILAATSPDGGQSLHTFWSIRANWGTPCDTFVRNVCN
jgi:hypothetical protein